MTNEPNEREKAIATGILGSLKSGAYIRAKADGFYFNEFALTDFLALQLKKYRAELCPAPLPSDREAADAEKIVNDWFASLPPVRFPMRGLIDDIKAALAVVRAERNEGLVAAAREILPAVEGRIRTARFEGDRDTAERIQKKYDALAALVEVGK